jgi:hypothetical protein
VLNERVPDDGQTALRLRHGVLTQGAWGKEPGPRPHQSTNSQDIAGRELRE